MRVLVAGGAGYIGSAICHGLVEAGHEVTVYDNLSTGHRDALPQGVTLIVGDTGDAESGDHVFSAGGFEAVMDFAAFIDASGSMSVPERYFRNNTANALCLLEAMLKHGVSKFVFSSSAAVYGDAAAVSGDTGESSLNADLRLAPNNPYGTSKLHVEQMLKWFNLAHGLRFACLRYFNAAGALSPDIGEDHEPESHLVPIVLGCALGRQDSVSVYGTDYPTADGTCIRDYVHVVDLATAHLLALDALSDREQITYDIGNGSGFSVNEVIQAARRVTGRPIPAVERARRAGDPAALVARSTAIREELGWAPLWADLDEIVGSAWEWHVGHPDGFGPVST